MFTGILYPRYTNSKSFTSPFCISFPLPIFYIFRANNGHTHYIRHTDLPDKRCGYHKGIFRLSCFSSSLFFLSLSCLPHLIIYCAINNYRRYEIANGDSNRACCGLCHRFHLYIRPIVVIAPFIFRLSQLHSFHHIEDLGGLKRHLCKH